MTDEEFREKYGRDPVKPGRRVKTKIYWDRIIIALVLLALLIFGVVKAISAIAGAIKGSKDDSSAAVTEAAVNSVPEESSSDSGQAVVQQDYQLTVCLDPGHGGDDGGAVDENHTRAEKDDDLNMCLKIRDELEAEGVNVVMTRDTDIYLSLEEICDKANDEKADLFVSIHRNSADKSNKGVEIWVNNHEPEADTLLASNILSALDRVGISENRNVNYGFIGDLQSNYQVNRQTKMPSCLVELGFITNKKDNELLDEHFDDYAKAIAQAILKTSVELGITDENGARLHEGQYLSTKPQYNPETKTYFTEEGEIYYADDLNPVVKEPATTTAAADEPAQEIVTSSSTARQAEPVG